MITDQETNVYNVVFGNDDFLLQVYVSILDEEYKILLEAMNNGTIIEGTCCGTTKCTLCNLGRTKIRQISWVEQEVAKLYHCDTEWKCENIETFEKILDILSEKL